MQKKLLLFVCCGLSFLANAQTDMNQSALLNCYRAHETHVQITACMDNQWRIVEQELNKAENALISYLVKMAGHSRSQKLHAAKEAETYFNIWREHQCKMVEKSFDPQSGGQGYLNCLIELTYEQIERLNLVMGVKTQIR